MAVRTPLTEVTTLINEGLFNSHVNVDTYVNLNDQRIQQIIAIVVSRIETLADLNVLKIEFDETKENIPLNKQHIYTEAFKRARDRLAQESSGGRRKQKRSTKKRKHLRKRKTSRRS